MTTQNDTRRYRISDDRISQTPDVVTGDEIRAMVH